MSSTDEPTPPRRYVRLGPDFALGVCVVVIGVALLLDTLQILPAIRILRFWPVGLILIGLGMLAQAWSPGSESWGRALGFRPLFLFAMLVAMFGFTSRVRWQTGAHSDSDDTVSVSGVMSQDQHISVSQHFRGADVTSVMGGSDLDLRQAAIAPGAEATVDVVAVMGQVTLRVPADWVVDVQLTPLLGFVRDQRAKSDGASAGQAMPRIVVRGAVMMGTLQITSGSDYVNRRTQRFP